GSRPRGRAGGRPPPRGRARPAAGTGDRTAARADRGGTRSRHDLDARRSLGSRAARGAPMTNIDDVRERFAATAEQVAEHAARQVEAVREELRTLASFEGVE